MQLNSYLLSVRPMLELCIPSSMDPTLAPPGCHVLSIFSQYTPYTLHTGPWTDQDREEYANCGQYDALAFSTLVTLYTQCLIPLSPMLLDSGS